MSLKDAKKAIEAAGFKVGNITYDWDSSIGKGYVIYQQYQANSQLDKGTSIDLQVSSGPEPDPEEPPDTGDDDDNKDKNKDKNKDQNQNQNQDNVDDEEDNG